MQAIITAFWQIVLFRSGPQTLPASNPLLIFVALVYVAANTLFVLVEFAADSLPAVLADLLLLIVWCSGLLIFFNFSARIVQTLTALFGTGALLQFLTLPIVVLADFGLPAGIYLLAVVMVWLWSTAVHGFVLAEALDKSFGVGVALAVVYFLLSNGLVGALLVPVETP